MKYLTEGMEPERVLRYFEEICHIPHGTGNEEALAHYVMNIASENGFETEKDQYNNVLVRMPASPGSENAPMFLMQGHMDMVCVKEPGCSLDMDKEPVILRRDGNILSAEGTSLGADNAVGLSNMLAVMTDKELKHPEMELLFTVREETGLEGIRLYDTSHLKSRKMMTMDCGDPDVLILGSAGSVALEFSRRFETEEAAGKIFVVNLENLHGGHTGLEVGNGYGNALTMLTEVLNVLNEKYGAKVCRLAIGGGMSCIPNSGILEFAVLDGSEEEIRKTVDDVLNDFKEEFSITEKDMSWTVENAGTAGAAGAAGNAGAAGDAGNAGNAGTAGDAGNAGNAGTAGAAGAAGNAGAAVKVLSEKSTRDLLDILMFAAVGDQRRHPVMQNLVLGSALLKAVSVEDGLLQGAYAIRSNFDSYKYRMANAFERLCKRYGLEYIIKDDNPAWPEKADSQLTQIAAAVYEKCFGCRPKKELVHGGEEASIVAYKIPDMEIIGIAPYSRGAHTTNEYLRLDTMLPIWNFIKALLEELSRM